MAVELTDPELDALANRMAAFFHDEFDEDLSVFRASEVVKFVAAEFGPVIYNRAVQDARAYMQSKLDDLDGEVFAAPE